MKINVMISVDVDPGAHSREDVEWAVHSLVQSRIPYLLEKGPLCRLTNAKVLSGLPLVLKVPEEVRMLIGMEGGIVQWMSIGSLFPVPIRILTMDMDVDEANDAPYVIEVLGEKYYASPWTHCPQSPFLDITENLCDGTIPRKTDPSNPTDLGSICVQKTFVEASFKEHEKLEERLQKERERDEAEKPEEREYEVCRREVWMQRVKVKAKTEADARSKAYRHEGDTVGEPEFTHCMNNSDDWEVEELP